MQSISNLLILISLASLSLNCSSARGGRSSYQNQQIEKCRFRDHHVNQHHQQLDRRQFPTLHLQPSEINGLGKALLTLALLSPAFCAMADAKINGPVTRGCTEVFNRYEAHCKSSGSDLRAKVIDIKKTMESEAYCKHLKEMHDGCFTFIQKYPGDLILPGECKSKICTQKDVDNGDIICNLKDYVCRRDGNIDFYHMQHVVESWKDCCSYSSCYLESLNECSQFTRYNEQNKE